MAEVREGARPDKTSQMRISGFRIIYWMIRLIEALCNVLHWFGVRVMRIVRRVRYVVLVIQHPT